MIVVYEKETNKFVGMALQVYDSGKMRDYTMEELYPSIDHAKHGFFIVDDSIEQLKLGNKVKFKLDKKGKPVGFEDPSLLRIVLSTNAQDQDGDGIPEIAAPNRQLAGSSGPESQAEITVQIMDGDKKAALSMDVLLSTTGGSLESRLLTTSKSGTASTTIFAGTDTVTLTVTASAQDLPDASLMLEVMPLGDIPKLAKRRIKV
jgi:hypothetical protein